MNKPNSNRSTHTQHVSDETSAPSTKNPIEQQAAGNSKSRDVDTHHGITIKWSLDSASRRPVGLPPAAALAAAGAVRPGAGDGSC